MRSSEPQMRNCASGNLVIPGLVLAHHPGMTTAEAYATRLAAPALTRIVSRQSIISEISSRVTLSAGMKRSASGCGELMSTPSASASATIAAPIGSFRSSASNNPRPRTSPRPCRADSFCNSLSRNRPASATAFRNSGFENFFEHREPCRAHQRIAVEGAALVAVFEARRVLGREQGSQRHAAADALAERHDVGLDTGMFVMEQLSGSAHAGLDLVDDQEQA